MKRAGVLIVAVVLWGTCAPRVFAEKITIAFTGQSYAALYPCACPHNPEGGVARRSTVIKELRSKEPNLLVVEAGDSVGSGEEDDNAQGKALDQGRSELYLAALKTMGYDALLVSRQDLAFGQDFLKRVPAPAFVSSNTTGIAVPYVIKTFKAFKVGIVGLTDRSRADISWGPAPIALKETMEVLKKEKVDLVVVLSAVTPSEDIDFASQITDLPVVVINGRPSYGSLSLVEMGSGMYTTTPWQAKSVGVLTLNIVRGKIKEKHLRSLPLGVGVADDPEITKSVPACLKDQDCLVREGSLGQCLDALTPQARCVYTPLSEAPPVSVIVPDSACRTCRVEAVLAAFEQKFGKVRILFLKEKDAAAQALMKELKITMLPAYVFDKSIERHAKFSMMKEMLDIGPTHAMLKPGVAGVSYFVGRERIPKRLDVFFDFGYSDLAGLMALVKDFQVKHSDWTVRPNFLIAKDEKGALTARGGADEIREFKRAACLAKSHPDFLFDYLICRASQRNAAWWDLCVAPLGAVAAEVDKCAASDEGESALQDYVRLTGELEVAAGPTFLVENVEVFGIAKVPTLEELERSVT